MPLLIRRLGLQGILRLPLAVMSAARDDGT